MINGRSLTTIDVPVEIVLSGALLLDIKRPAQESGVSALCNVIPEALFFNLEMGKNGNQYGIVVAFQQAGGTKVDVFIKPGPPGVAQPAFIRLGNCEDLGGIRYSLNHIVDGTSKTFLGAPFNVFRKEKAALNVHRSLQELEASVACGAIKSLDPDSELGDFR